MSFFFHCKKPFEDTAEDPQDSEQNDNSYRNNMEQVLVDVRHHAGKQADEEALNTQY